MTLRVLAVVTLMLVAFTARTPAHLHIGIDADGRVTPLRWTTSPVRWWATDRGTAGVPAAAFQGAVARAFDTWENVPTAAIAFAFGGYTAASPLESDGLSVVGFRAEPELERVLGATDFVIDEITGDIVEADIFFNTIFPWSTAAAGEPGRFDLQSVATHEIGHFLGLGHSALGETEIRPSGGRRVLGSAAVMFPIAFGSGIIADRTLQPDDVAGVSDLYPDGDFRQRTGVLAGRVLLNGRPVFGAHVVAFHLESGALVAGFTLNGNGEFRIAGLQPGPHVVRVEPLDDAEIDAFFGAEDVTIDFRPTVYPRLVVVPARGVAPRFDVTVDPK